VLGWVTTHIQALRYEDVRCQATADGFVQQHVLRGTVGAGVEIAIPACIVTTIRDGRITRLDEYLDSAHVKPLLAVARGGN
jgi:ketosteroid isomerase-like protein